MFFWTIFSSNFTISFLTKFTIFFFNEFYNIFSTNFTIFSMNISKFFRQIFWWIFSTYNLLIIANFRIGVPSILFSGFSPKLIFSIDFLCTLCPSTYEMLPASPFTICIIIYVIILIAMVIFRIMIRITYSIRTNDLITFVSKYLAILRSGLDMIEFVAYH